MKYMEIKSKLDKSQFNEVRMLYADFFRSINFNNDYNERMINVFSFKKAKDCFSFKRFSKYFFIEENGKLIGFINGKILLDKTGLISHVYVKDSINNKHVLYCLIKKLSKWFRQNGVSIVEFEISKANENFENVERNNWKKIQEFDDAIVYQRKL